MTALRVALAGLVGVGADMLAAIRDDDQFDLVAVADQLPGAIRTLSNVYRGPFYDDYRRLMIETGRQQLDALFVALAPFQCAELLELAADRGVAVFHTFPPARTVRETDRLAGRCKTSAWPMVVARPWYHEPEFGDLQNLREHTGELFLCEARVATSTVLDDWRGDVRKAGGGVLLHGAYEPIDLVTSVLGIPYTVHALCGVIQTKGDAPIHDTEDIALVNLQFAKRCVACVRAIRRSPDSTWTVTFFGASGSVQASDQAVTIRDRNGKELGRRLASYANRLAPSIRAFGRELGSTERKFTSSIEEHVATLAVIETAYLSARTGAAESPSDTCLSGIERSLIGRD